MKIRTKLVLLLSAALVVTIAATAWLRVRWTRETLDSRARDQADETAQAIAADLENSIKEDTDDDEISERLKYEQRKHRTVDKIEFTFDSDEDTTVSFHLDFAQEDPQIEHTARPQRRQRPPVQRRDEARRALLDHGETGRAPGERMVEPQWRTPDRAESARWWRLAPRPAAVKRRTSQPIVVDIRDEARRRDHRYLQASAPVDPEGPRRGQVVVWQSLDDIDRLIRTEEVVSAVFTGAALLILMLLAAVIVDRVVGKPVEELARAMREVEKGNLSRRVEVGQADEMGALSRGFNAMLGRLSEAHEEIRAFNLRLADEVRAATLDLARKNEALAHLNRLLVETRRELGDKDRLAVLGQLAAQLAHELGTPLSSVSGHLQLALSSREITQGLKERLAVARSELERVSKIVRDYLDSTRPVAPTRVACDLGRVVEEALGIAIGAQPRADLVVERRIDEEAVRVETDPGLVRQILINLLTNAIDATGATGAGRIEVAVTLQDGAVAIAVTDDGVGVRPEDVVRIFEPFYTTKGRGKGTGLGLAICRELAQALGGRIAVTSQPGAGSTFTVWLPRDGGSGERRGLRDSATGERRLLRDGASGEYRILRDGGPGERRAPGASAVPGPAAPAAPAAPIESPVGEGTARVPSK
ncbi:MAG TPA: ATP-binding protein [Polyangia bacterium]|nr:ATP-binding protein [Polyangia bacterium]